MTSNETKPAATPAKATKAAAAAPVASAEAPVGSILNPAPLTPASNRSTLDDLNAEFRASKQK